MTPQERTEIINDIFTTTWRKVQKDVRNLAFQITPLFNKLLEGGGIREAEAAGRAIDIPISYDKLDQNITYLRRGGKVGMAEKESLTQLTFYKRTLATSVVRYYADDIQNRTPAQIINYAEYKLGNTKNAVSNRFEEDLWTQNSDAEAITALPSLVTTTPTVGTIGGLTRSNSTVLQNQAASMSGKTVTGELYQTMVKMYHDCSKVKDGKRPSPNMIITDQTTYELYERLMFSLQQIVTSDSIRASLGFGNLLFKGVELYWAPNCPAQTMYFLNTEHLSFKYDPAAWMTMTPWKQIPDQLDQVCQIVCIGNMTLDNMQKQGVIYTIPTTYS